ncbi:hypothetical protein LFM09_45105 [Lentzea alba]|uniref:hypothetical protein n=1 Tax=Lentzea alba TaxID=2714351 RepID=UPI0039BF216C
MSDLLFRTDPGLHVLFDDAEGAVKLSLIRRTGEPPIIVDDVRLPWSLSAIADRRVTKTEAIAAWSVEPEVAAVAEELWTFLVEHELVTPVLDSKELPVPAYHVATRDHPFLDMSRRHESVVDDNSMMQIYLHDDAFKYPGVYLDLGAELAYSLEDARDLGVEHLWAQPDHHYAFLFSGTFGKRRHLAPYYDPTYNYMQVELIYKSVPSGGSKHPTEAFLVVLDSAVVEPGVYHFDVCRNGLAKLDVEIPGAIQELADREQWRGYKDTVLVLYHSVVERAMWRYRDARSFRALFVDIGHAEGHLSALASFAGWSYRSVPLTAPMAELARSLPVNPEDCPLLWAGVVSR